MAINELDDPILRAILGGAAPISTGNPFTGSSFPDPNMPPGAPAAPPQSALQRFAGKIPAGAQASAPPIPMKKSTKVVDKGTHWEIQTTEEPAKHGLAAVLPQIASGLVTGLGMRNTRLAQQQETAMKQKQLENETARTQAGIKESEQNVAASKRAMASQDITDQMNKERMASERLQRSLEGKKTQDQIQALYDVATDQTKTDISMAGAQPGVLSKYLADYTKTGNPDSLAKFQEGYAHYPSADASEVSHVAAGLMADPQLARYYGVKNEADAVNVARTLKPRLALAELHHSAMEDKLLAAQTANAESQPGIQREGLIQNYNDTLAKISEKSAALNGMYQTAVNVQEANARLNDPNTPAEMKKEIHDRLSAQMFDPNANLDPNVVKKEIDTLNGMRDDIRKRVLKLDPKATFTDVGTGLDPASASARSKAALDAAFPMAGKPSTLSPEQQAVSDQLSAQRGGMTPEGLLNSIPGGGLLGGAYKLGGHILNVGGLMAGSLANMPRTLTAMAGGYDKDPEFIKTYQSIATQVAADAKAGVPGADKITPNDIAAQTERDYVRSLSSPGFMPESIFGKMFLAMSPEERQKLYASALSR